MKVVINIGIGGFAISKEAAKFMAARGNKIAEEELKIYNMSPYSQWHGYGDISVSVGGYVRTDPILIEAVEKLGEEANYASLLKIVTIPDDIEWYIWEADDGSEAVHEKHRIWE